MKYYLLIFFATINLGLSAQIAKPEIAQNHSKSSVTDIVVVFKMHVDIGYTNWAEGVLYEYSNDMLDKTLKAIDETSILPESEQFVWTIPAWPLKYMLENCSDKNKTRLEKAIKEGRIIPHALPVTFETEASDLENLVRGLTYASEINSTYNLPQARDAKLTDVPSHSRALPTVLKNAGVDFLHIGCNPGSTSPDVPRLFWWQGPDGSRLLTLYWAEYYGSGILPPENWPHKTWLAMIHTHENTGAPSPDEVAELLKKAKEEMPNVNIKTGRLSDFHDLLVKEELDLPVISGDMPDTWIHGYMSMPRETRLCKFLQRETYNTEMLNSQMRDWGMSANPIENQISKAVENMILYEEHTFGAAMTHSNQHKWTYNDEFKINKSLGNYDFIEGTWYEKGNRIRSAEKIIVPLMKRQLKQLASSVNVDGKKIVVYNPLPWSRKGRVSFFAGVYQKKFKIYGVKDVSTGKVLPVYEDYNLISFDSDSIPSMGYKTYIPVLEPIKTKSHLKIDRDNNLLENKYFKLKIDPQKGILSSAFDKQNKKELVDVKSHEGFGEYFMEQAGQKQIDIYNKAYVKKGSESWANDEMIRPSVPQQETEVYRGTCEKIVYLNMNNAVRATVFGKLNNKESQRYMVTYTLYEDQPYIEIDWGVDGKKPAAQPQAGWISFPFDIDKPEYRLYRTGGIVDPQRELVENTNSDFYFLNTSMTMFDKTGKGAALNCPTSPGVSIDAQGLFKFSQKRSLKTGQVFVNLYNTQWGTNFTEWIEGSFSSKMFIWSYNKYDSESTFITPSEETRIPLKGVFYDGPKRKSLPSGQGISVNKKGVLVTAYKDTPEGKLLRLWEQAGKSGPCKVTLPESKNYKNAYWCNLRGEKINDKAIEIVNNTIQFEIKANQPVSLILK